MIRNKDWENWQKTMHVEPVQPAEATGSERPVVTRPRPGHADLAGVVKYGHDDIRNVLERASARETAARVAIGALSGIVVGAPREREEKIRQSIQVNDGLLPDSALGARRDD